MNTNRLLKYTIALCLTLTVSGIISAQSAVSGHDKDYGSHLYERIMQLNPDILLQPHGDPAVYKRSISAANGCNSVYS